MISRPHIATLAGVLGVAGCMAATPAFVQQGGWSWQLSEPLDLGVAVDTIDLDPDSVSAADIAALKARGITTIAYVSVGTVEDWRADAGHFPAGVVGRTYDDWPGERFLDIRQRDVLLPLMAARFQRAADMGFDAIEPDNMDVHTNDSGFDITAADTLAYVRALAELAHGMGLEIGQKNVPELTGSLVGALDFVIAEDCYADGWCDEILAYGAAGKPMFNAEYTDTGVNFAAACAYARPRGIQMILQDRDLTGASKNAC